MKKILFLMAYPLEERNRHLNQKFDAQIQAAVRLGLDSWYTAYAKDKIYLCRGSTKACIGKSIQSTQNILQCHFIYQKIKDILAFQAFDYCYVRNVPPIPAYISALKTIKQSGCKVIVEIPTYRNNPQEHENKNRKLLVFAHRLLELTFGKRVPGNVDLFTLIGDAAQSYQGVKALNIQNGVDCENFALKERSLHREGELHLLALACMSYWHGYDRVIEGLRRYYQETRPVKVFLHLVGNAGDDSLQKWKDLARQYNLEEYVFFEGFKSGVDLDQAIDQADIAIGSLGLYREKLEGASSIKVAEYCARGMPFIFAGKNKLLEDQPYWRELPNDETPVDIEEVIQFANEVWEIPDVQVRMRAYARHCMSWENQLRTVLEQVDAQE
ncbi:MAG TPA: glycosyltransferase [Anaerolineaceae bacterium]|nr:glycosyltransferase [Anaerolineaceae bacterium]